MRNQKGFTLVELLVSTTLMAIFIMASIVAMLEFTRSEKKNESNVQVKKILLALSSDLSHSRSKLPYFEVGSNAGAYVLCYDRNGVQQPFSAVENIHLDQVQNLLPDTMLCMSPIEIRITTEMSGSDTIWNVTGVINDPATNKIMALRPFVISRWSGF